MRCGTGTILWGALILAFAFTSSAAPLEQRTPARVKRVIDGDTFNVEVRLWPGIFMRTNVRLRGVDAPEIRRARCGEAERRKGRAARDFVRGVIGREVWLINVKHGKSGQRVVASVRLADGRNLADLLIDAGHARPYWGGRRPKWC